MTMSSTRLALPPVETVALITVRQLQAFDHEFDRVTTRFRISNKTLRIISQRPLLTQSFREEYFSELARLGYSAFSHGDHVAIIISAAVGGWVRISSDRIEAEMGAIIGQDPAVIANILDTLERSQRSAAKAKQLRKSRKKADRDE